MPWTNWRLRPDTSGNYHVEDTTIFKMLLIILATSTDNFIIEGPLFVSEKHKMLSSKFCVFCFSPLNSYPILIIFGLFERAHACASNFLTDFRIRGLCPQFTRNDLLSSILIRFLFWLVLVHRTNKEH